MAPVSDALTLLQAELDTFEAVKLDLETQKEGVRRLTTALRNLERSLVPACKNALDYGAQQRERGHQLSGELAKSRLELATMQDRLRNAQKQLGEAAVALDVPLQVLDEHQYRHQGVDPHQAVSHVIGILGRVSRLHAPKSQQGRGRTVVSSATATRGTHRSLSVSQDIKGLAVYVCGGPEDDEQLLGSLTPEGYLQLEPIRPEIAERLGLQLAGQNRVRVVP